MSWRKSVIRRFHWLLHFYDLSRRFLSALSMGYPFDYCSGHIAETIVSITSGFAILKSLKIASVPNDIAIFWLWIVAPKVVADDLLVLEGNSSFRQRFFFGAAKGTWRTAFRENRLTHFAWQAHGASRVVGAC
jgi:hypothetical protein